MVRTPEIQGLLLEAKKKAAPSSPEVLDPAVLPGGGRRKELAGWVDVPWVGKETAAPSSDCRRERRRRRLARSDRWTAAPGSI
jgi:hypothetical protein